jgi:hypothetical protein
MTRPLVLQHGMPSEAWHPASWRVWPRHLADSTRHRVRRHPTGSSPAAIGGPAHIPAGPGVHQQASPRTPGVWPAVHECGALASDGRAGPRVAAQPATTAAAGQQTEGGLEGAGRHPNPHQDCGSIRTCGPMRPRPAGFPVAKGQNKPEVP